MKLVSTACLFLFASMPLFAGEVGTGGNGSADASPPVEPVESDSHWQDFLDALSGSFDETTD